jgi:hypothetical protein
MSAEEIADDKRREKEEATAAEATQAEPVKSFPANVERQRQRILRRKVERVLDKDEETMQWCLMADDLDFATYGELVDVPGAKGEDFYIYKDNGADVLAVAHLDSVEEKQRFFYITDDARLGDIVCSPALDDRLGVYVILELLPKLGIKTDILLTVGEEHGNSTGRSFVVPTGKRYNWMFQFDRTGTDVVMYQYETEQRRKLLASVNAVIGRGSFSDIVSLGKLGCAGFNWGVGYHDYHGPRAWASLHELIIQVTRFMRFHERYQDVHMKWDGVARRSWSDVPASSYGGWTGTYGRWRDAKGMDDKPANGVHNNGGGNGAKGTGFRTAISGSTRIIPDIDQQLAGRKRGSRRGKRGGRKNGIRFNGMSIDPADLSHLVEGRCPVCNSHLDDDKTGPWCPVCMWDVASGLSASDHVLSMTDEEFARYERQARQIEMEDTN